MFRRNICWLSMDHMALYPRKLKLFITTTMRTSNTTLQCRGQSIFTKKIILYDSAFEINEHYKLYNSRISFILHIHYLIKSIRTSLCSSKLKPRCHYDRTYLYKRRQKAVCCSLLSSTSSMGRSGELSNFEYGLVFGCHISKKSVSDIATLLKLPKSTAGDVILKWKCEGTTTTKPWPDRPRLMTGRGRWALKKVVPETHRTSSETITREFRTATSCQASTLTVCWKLRGMGFHGRAAAHKPNISPVNAKRRLKWCKEHCYWTWTTGIWCDESCYNVWQ
jgi:hypothetical protein